MTSLTYCKHLTSQVPGDINPLISSLDVICERLHSDIWANLSCGRMLLVIMLFFFLLREPNYDLEINLHQTIKPCNLLWSKACSTAFYWPIKCLLVVLPSRVLGENKLLKWVMKHVFHLPQSLFGLNPLQLFAWSTINYVFVFVFFLKRCSVGHWCGASFIVVYIVFIWEVNYGFCIFI